MNFIHLILLINKMENPVFVCEIIARNLLPVYTNTRVGNPVSLSNKLLLSNNGFWMHSWSHTWMIVESFQTRESSSTTLFCFKSHLETMGTTIWDRYGQTGIVHKKVIKTAKGLEIMPCEKQLRKLSLFYLKKGLRNDMICHRHISECFSSGK